MELLGPTIELGKAEGSVFDLDYVVQITMQMIDVLE